MVDAAGEDVRLVERLGVPVVDDVAVLSTLVDPPCCLVATCIATPYVAPIHAGSANKMS